MITVENIYQIPDRDILTYQLLKTGLTAGIFQYENTALLGPLLRKAVTESIDDMAAMASIIRPGTLNFKFDGESATNHYVKRSAGEEDDIFDPPQLEPILKDTHGLFLYQEQSLRAAKELAGFSGSEAMRLQKGISKKKADVIMEVKPLFIKGCVSKGMSESDAENIFSQIETSNRYSFNKCISKNTLIRTTAGNISVERLYHLKNKGFGYSMDSAGNIKVNEIVDVYYSGRQKVYRLTLVNHKYIDTTDNHRFPTNFGELKLSDINEEVRFGCLKLYTENDLKIYTENGLVEPKSVEFIGEQDVYDIEMTAPNHNFLTSQGIVTCNSHAVSYSYISYVCAYLKAHFLKEFMVATLRFAKHKIDHYNEIDKLVKECKQFGLDIRPPSILKPCIDFTYIDNKIYFGLSNIKGIGEAQAEKLMALTYVGDWYPLLLSIKNLNKTTVENSILVGVFSHIKMARRKMLDDYRNLKLLTNKEMDWVDENWKNYTSLASLIEGLIPHATKQRIEKLKSLLQLILDPAESLKDSVEDITAAEKDLLGANVSFNNIDKIEKLGTTTIEEFKEGKVLKQHSIIAEIKNIKQHIIKNGNSAGKTMVFLNILDQTSNMDCVVFANVYEEYGGYLSVGRCLNFIGVRGDKGGFVVNQIKDIR